MQRITSESKVDEVLKGMATGREGKLRESETRRRNLERFAKLRSRNPQTSLSLEDTSTAFVESEDDDDEFIDITITTKKFNQPSSYSLPEEYHNYLIQKGMTIHEAAHIMYSSYPEYKKYINKVKDEDDHVKMFKNIFNFLEDGAIETFCREDYRIDEEITHLRSSIHDHNYVGQKVEMGGGKDKYHYPFYYAVGAALLNMGIYDNGELRKLLDDDNDQHQIAFRGGEQDKESLTNLLPTIKNHIKEIHNKRDCEERYKLIYNLWEEIKKYINRSTTPGKKEMERQMQNRGDSYASGVPENLKEAHGDSQEIRASSKGGEDGEKKGEPEIPSPNPDGKKVEKMEKKAKQSINSEVEGESNLSEEIEELIDTLSGGEGTDEVFIPDDGTTNEERKVEAKMHGKRCAKILRNRLKKHRRDKVKRGKKRGNLDTRRMIQAERGSPDIFWTKGEGEEKNYSAMIVCDRSGSMRSNIDKVEIASGSVAYGLEELGVDTSIVDTYDSKTAISKPFQTSVSDFERKILSGRNGGGTPIRHTIRFARERMERGDGKYPLMIIITDGGASQKEKFKEEVNKANFPVLGLYIGSNKYESQKTLYNSSVKCSSNEDVSSKLIDLLISVMT